METTSIGLKEYEIKDLLASALLERSLNEVKKFTNVSESTLKVWRRKTHYPRKIDDINTLLIASGKTFNDFCKGIREEEEIQINCSYSYSELLSLKNQTLYQLEYGFIKSEERKQLKQILRKLNYAINEMRL